MDSGRRDDFRYFLAIAKTSSIKKAAAELKTTQSAVSKRLERLEAALNARLFERGPAGAKITYQGQRILDKFLAPDLNWREMHHEAMARNNRDPAGTKNLAAEALSGCCARRGSSAATYRTILRQAWQSL